MQQDLTPTSEQDNKQTQQQKTQSSGTAGYSSSGMSGGSSGVVSPDILRSILNSLTALQHGGGSGSMQLLQKIIEIIMLLLSKLGLGGSAGGVSLSGGSTFHGGPQMAGSANVVSETGINDGFSGSPGSNTMGYDAEKEEAAIKAQEAQIFSSMQTIDLLTESAVGEGFTSKEDLGRSLGWSSARSEEIERRAEEFQKRRERADKLGKNMPTQKTAKWYDDDVLEDLAPLFKEEEVGTGSAEVRLSKEEMQEKHKKNLEEHRQFEKSQWEEANSVPMMNMVEVAQQYVDNLLQEKITALEKQESFTGSVDKREPAGDNVLPVPDFEDTEPKTSDVLYTENVSSPEIDGTPESVSEGEKALMTDNNFFEQPEALENKSLEFTGRYQDESEKPFKQKGLGADKNTIDWGAMSATDLINKNIVEESGEFREPSPGDISSYLKAEKGRREEIERRAENRLRKEKQASRLNKVIPARPSDVWHTGLLTEKPASRPLPELPGRPELPELPELPGAALEPDYDTLDNVMGSRAGIAAGGDLKADVEVGYDRPEDLIQATPKAETAAGMDEAYDPYDAPGDLIQTMPKADAAAGIDEAYDPYDVLGDLMQTIPKADAAAGMDEVNEPIDHYDRLGNVTPTSAKASVAEAGGSYGEGASGNRVIQGEESNASDAIEAEYVSIDMIRKNREEQQRKAAADRKKARSLPPRVRQIHEAMKRKALENTAIEPVTQNEIVSDKPDIPAEKITHEDYLKELDQEFQKTLDEQVAQNEISRSAVSDKPDIPAEERNYETYLEEMQWWEQSEAREAAKRPDEMTSLDREEESALRQFNEDRDRNSENVYKLTREIMEEGDTEEILQLRRNKLERMQQKATENEGVGTKEGTKEGAKERAKEVAKVVAKEAAVAKQAVVSGLDRVGKKVGSGVNSVLEKGRNWFGRAKGGEHAIVPDELEQIDENASASGSGMEGAREIEENKEQAQNTIDAVDMERSEGAAEEEKVLEIADNATEKNQEKEEKTASDEEKLHADYYETNLTEKEKKGREERMGGKEKRDEYTVANTKHILAKLHISGEQSELTADFVAENLSKLTTASTSFSNQDSIRTLYTRLDALKNLTKIEPSDENFQLFKEIDAIQNSSIAGISADLWANNKSGVEGKSLYDEPDTELIAEDMNKWKKKIKEGVQRYEKNEAMARLLSTVTLGPDPSASYAKPKNNKSTVKNRFQGMLKKFRR